ncbi:MAG: histidine triad nucleotide-binding protein [Syntrophomonadaceae bacterium]|nr:histidine triad nucleotide-binding protein [Syntrophomonadaceae bacterium]
MEDCLFCRMGTGEVDTNKVYEDENIIAIHDINPTAPVHILLIPKRHLASLRDAAEEDIELLGSIQLAASRVAKELSLESYRLVSNCGEPAGQEVFHLHYHLLGGREFAWPPG